MPNTTRGPLRNDEIAAKIAAVVARNKEGHRLQGEIESLLNLLLPSRRARSAARVVAAARIKDKKTSKDAALSVNVAAAEAVVLRTLLRFEGALTSNDIEAMSGKRYGSITPRMSPLRTKGMITEVGVDKSAGRGRTLYQITAEGRQYLAAHPAL
jgi:predicted transcriptional regulator